jgi:hypothetical protein
MKEFCSSFIYFFFTFAVYIKTCGCFILMRMTCPVFFKAGAISG